MAKHAVILALLLLVGCASAPESSLIMEKKREKAHDQMVTNISNVASANITGREREGFKRILAETKIEILTTAQKQDGKLSTGYVMGTLEEFQDNVRELMAVINIERELLGKARLDDVVYKQLSAEIFDYLSKLGRITPDQIRQFHEGVSVGGDEFIKDMEDAREAVHEEKKRQAEIEAAIEAAREKAEEGGGD